MEMKDRMELTDEELEQVVGGAKRIVHNDQSDSVYVYDSPNGESSYTLYNGVTVYTTGRVRYSDGYDWYQLDDGNWIQGNFIGY